MIKLTITVEGPVASGKTHLMEKIRRLLLEDADFKIDGNYTTKVTMVQETREYNIVRR